VTSSVLNNPFGFPGRNYREQGDYDLRRIDGLLALGKILSLFVIGAVSAQLMINGVEHPAVTISLSLTIMFLLFCSIPVKPLAGYRLFKYNSTLAITIFVISLYTYFSMINRVLDPNLLVIAGIFSAAGLAVVIYTLWKVDVESDLKKDGNIDPVELPEDLDPDHNWEYQEDESVETEENNSELPIDDEDESQSLKTKLGEMQSEMDLMREQQKFMNLVISDTMASSHKEKIESSDLEVIEVDLLDEEASSPTSVELESADSAEESTKKKQHQVSDEQEEEWKFYEDENIEWTD
jgi:hypothetical protein